MSSHGTDEETKYLLGNADTRESDRLDKQHRIIQDLVGPLLPEDLKLRKNYHVLDSGAGTGAWALELHSTLNPQTYVFITGIDINSRFFPASPSPNVNFVVHSIMVLPPAWTERFRFIHQRFLSAALSFADWRIVFDQMHRALLPKGWVRVEEFSATLCPTNVSAQKLPYSHQLLDYAGKFAKKAPLRMGPGDEYRGMRANFTNIWLYIRDSMKGHPGAMTDADFESLMANLSKELEENDVGWNLHIVTARKPGIARH
ncbi:S-adenosyl-L-methionine-dependent methyltransferase [Dacryopinax primogenitus]|uniref:S-adenosyl-L-methionine-dependent methyltransferase n=1 Tax=Dacryopinax primogenitus (strain DJM 731) TaxID=1858805 RepID=M5G7Q4_DACPD|nr:S-adenosyl-L-methionine-dependent methyltransferase [Dacryopinax primogenitus]EJT99807.1 S-adenosyl-L-methionine-dependent methyltransferase [Dacryopinax primogenitus]